MTLRESLNYQHQACTDALAWHADTFKKYPTPAGQPGLADAFNAGHAQGWRDAMAAVALHGKQTA